MEIYLCVLDEETRSLLRDDYTWEVLLRHMSLKERRGILNIRNEDGRYIKALNTLMFSYVMKIAHPTVETNIVRGKHGKPLDSTKNCGFNLSDEDGMVALALNLDGTEIGIDLATPSDINSFGIPPENFVNDDFRDIFTERERTHIHKLFDDCKTVEKKNLLLSQYWALKESYCKYIGIGITFGLDQFQFVHHIEQQDIGNLSDMGNSDFKLLGEIHLQEIDGYDPKNGIFGIWNTGIICSVFGHHEKAKILKVDLCKMVRYFGQ